MLRKFALVLITILVISFILFTQSVSASTGLKPRHDNKGLQGFSFSANGKVYTISNVIVSLHTDSYPEMGYPCVNDFYRLITAQGEVLTLTITHCEHARDTFAVLDREGHIWDF